MVPSSPNAFSWLPDHQLHVASTLGHVDHLIGQCSDVLIDYLKPGPLGFENIVDPADAELVHTVIRSVGPLPEAVSRFVADALTQLRNALEHTVFAEVEHELGRPLSLTERGRIEMPACDTAEDFHGWLKGRRRHELAPLHARAILTSRIETLQPFHRRNPQEHPLRILADHTNHAKHRSPAVASTQLGVVYPDKPTPELILPAGPDRPARIGDILATAPRRMNIPLNILPKVSLQRPGDGSWHVVMNELGELEQWVREVAIPILITGKQQSAQLPAQLDTTVGYVDLRAGLAAADGYPAVERSRRRIAAETLRVDIPQMLRDFSDLEETAISVWASNLSDDAVLVWKTQLEDANTRPDHERPWRIRDVFARMATEIEPGA